MKVPLSWLQLYLKTAISTEKIAETLTLAGIEVDAIDPVDGDEVLEISLTPNLGHCLSIIGIARELAALLHIPLIRQLVQFEEKGAHSTSQLFNIEIEDPKACPRFFLHLIEGVKVGPSPEWLQKRLINCGQRSVNNLVDIGNLVMLETGQPLHFFDADKIEGGRIIVKRAKGAAMLQTLDEVVREIPDGALIICDAEKPLSFAGIMGGLSSAISEKTTRILIESAHFSAETVRRTSKLLGLRTEGSARWERGVDPLIAQSALERAIELVLELAGGSAARDTAKNIALPYKEIILTLRPSRVNQMLGSNLAQREIATMLGRLEIQTLEDKDDLLVLLIPSHRHDLKAEIDLVEEVARLYGFNNLPKTPARYGSSTIPHAPLYILEEGVRSKLIAQRLQECLTCDLISPELSALTTEKIQGTASAIHVLHPASIEQSVLRTTLLPGLLQVVKYNLDHQNDSLAAFEVGHIHFKDSDRYYEQSAAAIILAGKEKPLHFETKSRSVDFFDIKGQVEDFLGGLGLNDGSFETSHLHCFHPGRQARVKINDVCIGFVGEIHPALLKQLDIPLPVYFAELNLNDLFPFIEKRLLDFQMNPIPSFPGSQRDWTVTLKDSTPLGVILEKMKAQSSPLLETVQLLDLYKSDKIGKDRKNATFRFQYRDLKKTVELQEVEKEHAHIILRMSEELKDYMQ